MYPNLMGQKAYHHLSNDDMGRIINISREAYEQKMRSGRFTPGECLKYCKFFNKSFEYLFALNDDAN